MYNMSCTIIKKKNRKVCIGNMRDLITLQNRAITPPEFGSVDFDENFTDIDDVWSIVNTVSGKTFFDGVNTEVDITHEIYIWYDATVTPETWVEFNGQRINILKVEDFDGRNQFMKLTCTERGANTIEATKT